MAKGNYVFPDFLAKGMMKVSMRTQMEASLLSMTFILVGMIIMALYIVIFAEFTRFFKIMTVINMLAGVVFLSSYLITTFQQYKNHLLIMGVIEKL